MVQEVEVKVMFLSVCKSAGPLGKSQGHLEKGYFPENKAVGLKLS